MDMSGRPYRRFCVDCVRLALYLLPIAYCAGIAAVAVHEVLGHGMTALAFGGAFRGFTLKWDGMGWALVEPELNAPLTHQVLIYAGGICATALSGVVLLASLLLVRRRPHFELTLLVLAMNMLLEGPPYAFWNALHPAPPGDVAVILALLNNAGRERISSYVRWTLFVSGGLVSIGTIVVGSLLFFRSIEDILGREDSLRGWRRLLALTLFVGLPGATGWLMFDWNQIAEGIGRMPSLVGAASSVVMAVLMYWKSLDPHPKLGGVRTTGLQISIAWTVCLATIISVTLFLSKGVTF